MPGIHVFLAASTRSVDGRDKPGHNEYLVPIRTAFLFSAIRPRGHRSFTIPH
jgi:hypothetical protein